ncbi:MAG: PAS domain-containing sensor histidine kinase, partial [Pedobacter sp.]
VIYNLLSNAIKYSPNGGRISITCNSDQDGSVQVNIHDLGMGIDKKEMDRVFDRYFRIENMDKSMISGFGIGLYLCKEIVHSHKGKIWAESDYGKGSTFSFAIPVDKQIVFN